MTTPTEVSARMAQRYDTAAQWINENPILLAGEVGIESDTGYIKVGNGSAQWIGLAYVSGLGAEIPVSRLADGDARQLLQTDAAGTGVEWTSDVDVPGTLDVTGAATFDANVTIEGDLTVNGTTTTIDTETLLVKDKNIEMAVVTTPTDETADGGGITLKGATDKTINWINATDAWTSSERFDFPAGTAAAPSIILNGDVNSGIYQPGADQVAISTNGTGRLFIDASGNIKITNGQYQALSHKLFGYSGSYGALVVGAGGDNYGNVSLGVDLSAISGDSFNGQNQVIFPATGGLIPNNAGDNFVGFYHRNSSDSLVLGPASNAGITSGPLTVTSTSLGLGTSSPDDVLDVRSGAAGFSQFVHASGQGGIRIAGTGASSDANLVFSNNHTSGISDEFTIQMNGATDDLLFISGGPGGTERVRITEEGRLGIGTTSPSILLDCEGSSTGDGVGLHLNNTAGANTILVSTGSSYSFSGVVSNTTWLTSSGTKVAIGPYTAGEIQFINGGEKARIDSSGRLLVGTSNFTGEASAVLEGSSAGETTQAQLWLNRGQANPATDNVLGQIIFGDATASGRNGAMIQGRADSSWASGDYPTRLVFSVTRDGGSSPTEAVRIKNTGYTTTFATTDGFRVSSAAAAGTGTDLFNGAHSATGIDTGTISFRVTTNGNVTNTNNSYGAISDAKLKENIVDANSQWDDLKALQVRNYNFKEGQTHTQIGLVAQEAELVSPGLVTESPDRDEDGNDLGTVTKSVNYSVLYMKAVKALQEAMERIEQLEAKVTALESA